MDDANVITGLRMILIEKSYVFLSSKFLTRCEQYIS